MSAVSPPLGYTGGRAVGPGGLAGFNPGWIMVVAAVGLSLVGSYIISITEPGLAKRQFFSR